MNDMLFNISITAILTGIIKALIPSDKYEKQIRIIISLFFIIVIAGFISRGFNLSFFTEIDSINTGYNDYTSVIYDMTVEETAKNLNNGIKSLLNEKGMYPKKIYIDTNILDNDCISIIEVKLIFRNMEDVDEEEAVRLVKSLVGYKTEVTVEEG